MERCPKCGNRLSHIDVLCPRCGALVEVIQVNKNFLPSTNSENDLSRRNERPNLIVYNEDFPSEGLFSNTDKADDLTDTTQAIPETPRDSFPDISNEPDFDLPAPLEEPLLQQTPEDAPLLQQTPEEEPLLQQIPEEKPLPQQTPEEEPLPESRMARRARERQWLELEEMNAAAASPESELLAEADKLTASAGDELRNEDLNTDIASDAIYQSTGPRRYRSRNQQTGAKPKAIQPKKLPPAAVIVLWGMAAAVIFLGFFYLNRYVQTNHGSYAAFIRQITNGKIELDTESALTHNVSLSAIASETDSGEPAHTFTVVAPGAISLRALPTGDVFDVQDGKATFTLSDEDMARALGVITYDAVFSTDGLSLELSYSSSTRSFTIEPLELFLRSSEYVREAPLDAYSSQDDTVAVSLLVAPGATVFINNENLSGEVGDDGLISVVLPLDSGENYFAVDVIQPGRQSIKDNFTVTRQLPKTLLEPEADYQRVYSGSFECRGTTDAGATLSAMLDDQTFAGLVSENGVFSVACKTEGFGLHMITLKARSNSGEETERSVAVEYVPEPGAFMKNAREMKIAAIIKDAANLSGVGIKLISQINNLSEENYVQRFSVGAGVNSLSCYYHGPELLSIDKTYTLYGMMDNNTNELYVMFVE